MSAVVVTRRVVHRWRQRLPWLPLPRGLCVPEVGLPPSRLFAPRVVAVTADPPEVAPGESVRLRLWVGQARRTGDRCRARRCWLALLHRADPPTEDNAVSARCLSDPNALLPIAGRGAEVVAGSPPRPAPGSVRRLRRWNRRSAGPSARR